MKKSKRRGSALHPGDVIRSESDRLGLSANAFAKALGVPGNRISEIMRGQRNISADTALRLARYLSTDPEYWMKLQRDYELDMAEKQSGSEIEKTVIPHNQAMSKKNGR